MEDEPIMQVDSRKLESEIRLGFIRKVFGIVCAQIFAIFLVTLGIYYSKELQDFLTGYIWISCIFATIYIVCMIILICVNDAGRKVPWNYILLGIITLSLSLIVATIASFYEPFSVLMILVLAIAITSSLCACALLTKTEFSTCWALSVVFCVCSIASIIMILSLSDGDDIKYFNFWICLLLYGFYLVFDIQLIAWKESHQIEHDDYIVGAMMIYVDLVQVFFIIFKNLGTARRR